MMAYIKGIVLFVVMCILTGRGMAQKNWKELFDEEYSEICTSSETMREKYLKISLSGNSYEFMTLCKIIDALQCMYLSTGEKAYLNDLIKIINNVLSTAQVSKNIPGNVYPYKDDYLTWVSKNRLSSYNNEAVLYEGYIFRFITLFLYHLHQSGWTNLSEANQDWYNQTLQFIEKNIWEKWISRSNRINGKPYTTFLRSRAHMGAHNAFIAFFLKEITTDPVIKTQCTELYN
ncbi:MAG TPA: AGE family epimerase/isomerase, partial [Niabella sp.]|nr:AGE family epimerase/isomerase [Niabella sp.]